MLGREKCQLGLVGQFDVLVRLEDGQGSADRCPQFRRMPSNHRTEHRQKIICGAKFCLDRTVYSLPIDFAEDDVDRADDRDEVGDEATWCEHFERL